jgi:hypothetical protein
MHAMYKILGSDGNEYGPVSAKQVKHWIAENRVDQKTPVFPDGAADWVFLESLPEFKAVFALPPPGRIRSEGGGGLNAVIPYKNVRALVAYYFAVFSVIPILGMPLGFIGMALGISGLRFQRQHPQAGGKVHAWIGIVLGGLFGFGYLALIILGIVGLIVKKHLAY